MRSLAGWSRPPSDGAIGQGEVRVWLATLDKPGAADEDSLAADEWARAAQFAFERDRRRFVAARALLRRLLAEQQQVEARDIRFSYDRYGKPSVIGHPSCPAFNVSHSGAMAVVALGHCGPLGIDIEAVRAIPDAEDIAERFFADGEREVLRSLPAAERELAFFECWTRKEAFIKAVGHGLTYPLDSFEVTLRPGDPVRVTTSSPADPHVDWTLIPLPPVPGYVGALAVGQPPRTIQFHAFQEPSRSAGAETRVS